MQKLNTNVKSFIIFSKKLFYRLQIAITISITFSSFSEAVIVYDNTTTPAHVASTIGYTEVGDEVHLGGTERLVTELLIGVNMQWHQGTSDFKARIYANDGTEGEPHTLLWESDLLQNVSLTGEHQLISFVVPDVKVPDVFTWTIQPSNSTPYQIDLPWYNPPTVGSSPDYSWQGSPPIDKVWSTKPRNFMSRVIAVPEPATLLLFGLGTLFLCSHRN